MKKFGSGQQPTTQIFKGKMKNRPIPKNPNFVRNLKKKKKNLVINSFCFNGFN